MNWDSLPEGWKVKLLGRVASLVMGQSPPSSSYNVHGKGLPFFQGKAEFGDLYPVPTKWCSSPVRIAEEDDVLLSVRAPVGPVNLSPSKCCIGRGLCAIRGRPNVITQKYLFYYLRSIESRIAEKSSGSTFTAITKPDIERLPIPLPPLEEQRRIVEILEQVDELRRKKRAALALVDKIVRSLFLEMFGDPGTNPKGWEVKELKHICRFETEQIIPEAGQEYFYVGLEHIESDTGRILKSSTTLGKHLLSSKHTFDHTHVLYGKLRPYLNKVALPTRAGICSTDILPLRANDDILVREYLAYYLRHPAFVRWATDNSTGTKMPRVQTAILKTHAIPIPPLPLQQRFAELVSHFEEKRQQMEQAAEALENLYRSLLKKAFTGELTKAWREANGIRWELPQLTDRQKLLLGVLHYHNSVRKVAPPVTVVMKNMFLLQEEQKMPLGYSFIPYKYGPFSKEVYEDLEVLEREMLVIRSKKGKIVERQETAIDEEAVDEVKHILETLPQDKKQALDEVMRRHASMGFEQLLGYVYTTYPEFAARAKRGNDVKRFVRGSQLKAQDDGG